MVHAESTPWVCRLWKWLGGGALICSVAIFWVHWPWGLLGGESQDQPPPVSYAWPPGISYKAICRWMLLVLGLELPQCGQAVNQSQLFLLGLEPLNEREGIRLSEVRCSLFKKI